MRKAQKAPGNIRGFIHISAIDPADRFNVTVISQRRRPAVSEAADEAAAQEAATSISEEAAANVHAVAVELVNGLAK